jgi:hypothetical protein
MNAAKKLLRTSCLSPFRISFSDTFSEEPPFGMLVLIFGLCANRITSGIEGRKKTSPGGNSTTERILKYRLNLDVSLRVSARAGHRAGHRGGEMFRPT